MAAGDDGICQTIVALALKVVPIFLRLCSLTENRHYCSTRSTHCALQYVGPNRRVHFGSMQWSYSQTISIAFGLCRLMTQTSPFDGRNIKGTFSRNVRRREIVGNSREAKRERGIWQRRFWEHAIRDQRDFIRHVDYIHYNPVKHGWVKTPSEWPYSSFQRYVARGVYPEDWYGPA